MSPSAGEPTRRPGTPASKGFLQFGPAWVVPLILLTLGQRRCYCARCSRLSMGRETMTVQAVDSDVENSAQAGVRPGTLTEDGRVLQLRGVVHDHLDPVRVSDRLRRRHAQRRTDRHEHRLAARRRHGHHRRSGDGGSLLQLPHRRRAVLLVGEARRQERAGVELVHGLVQPPRPGRGNRGHRWRSRALRLRLHEQLVRIHARRPSHPARLCDRADPARAAQHLRNPFGRAAQRRLRVVAHPRRRLHRRRAAHRPEAP